MAREKKIKRKLEEAGFTPLEDRAIVVKYTTHNLSAAIANFFSFDYYVLQLCEQELVLLPFSEITLAPIKKDAVLTIRTESVKKVEVKEAGFNFDIIIEMDDSTLTLTTQQKELSDIRSSGVLAIDWTKGNWHKENLEGTLEALKKLSK